MKSNDQAPMWHNPVLTMTLYIGPWTLFHLILRWTGHQVSSPVCRRGNWSLECWGHLSKVKTPRLPALSPGLCLLPGCIKTWKLQRAQEDQTKFTTQRHTNLCVVMHDCSKHHFSWCGFCCFVIDSVPGWSRHNTARYSFRQFLRLPWQQDLDIQIPGALPGYSVQLGRVWPWSVPS